MEPPFHSRKGFLLSVCGCRRDPPELMIRLASPVPALLNLFAMSFFAGKFVTEWLEGLGRVTLLAKEAANSLFTLRVRWWDFLYQLYYIGVKSQSVVLVTGAFTGMVLCAKPISNSTR